LATLQKKCLAAIWACILSGFSIRAENPEGLTAAFSHETDECMVRTVRRLITPRLWKNKMNRFSLLAALSAFVLVGSAAQAQDSSGLLEVLGNAKAATLNGTASISEEKPQKGGGFGVGAMVVVAGQGGQGGPSPFEGDVEVYVKDGTISAASSGKLPHVKIYQKGGKQLFSQVHSGKAVDTKALATLLSRALDMNSLMEEVKRAKRVRAKSIEGGNNYRVTIGGDYFDKKAEETDGGPGAQMAMAMAMSSMSESVLEAVLSVDVNGSGEMKALKLEVQYNDPMADMIAKAMKGGGGIQIGGAGGMGEKSTTPGKKITLDFAVSDTESKAAKAFADEATEVLK